MTAVEAATRPRFTAALAQIEAAHPGFMTFEGVEIAHVGMEWPSASGPVTLTFQHLVDAVAAENDDPHILSPRLKIGHDDPRFNESPAVHDPFAYHGPLRDDGNPVYGKAVNLSLSEDGMLLVGDFVEVPVWLGEAMPSAYPSRSLEGDWDVETEGGKKYSFVLTAVSLLGEPLPAITCLEDLARELTGGPAAVLEQTPVTLNKETTPMSTPVALEASTDAVRAQFFDEFAQGDRYWWWPCELRVEDGWVLADDDEGHLYRVPFTIDADGIVAFGDPVSGVLDFRPTPDPDAGETPVAAARGAVHFSSPQMAGRPTDRVRSAAAPTNEGASMAEETNNVSTALLERLGLNEDATPEDIQAATLARMDELEAAAPAVETEEQPEPVAASSDRGAVVDPDALAQLQADAQMGREAREEQIGLGREQFVDDRVRGGFITSASRDAHLAELSKGGEIEKTHRAYLASLAAAIVPVGERGINPYPENETAQLARVRAALGLKTSN